MRPHTSSLYLFFALRFDVKFSRWQKRGVGESTKERERDPRLPRAHTHTAMMPHHFLRVVTCREARGDPGRWKTVAVKGGRRNEDVNGGCEGE